MRIKIWLPLALVTLPALIFLLVFFYGNPVTKMESKQIAREYLDVNYPELPFIVSHVDYYPGEGIYIVHIITKDGTVKANLDVRRGKVVNDGLLEFK
ncbi:hypothetical protein JOC77_001167 [Peribacillus deserti]|uniref:YfjL-like N-terminal domain-containing protein n=1 Tax=Peribacillus deserti TaxID=673318 RepID=A0ABS2QF27_9BACI|nr:hypothetical protein [Peribacillus deserti]MBM7691760.1 hypothetical protein [Peribacillus deserti]